jgi:hypothetical protein
MNKLVINDSSMTLMLPQEDSYEARYRSLPAFKGEDEWLHISWLLDLNVWEEGEEGEEITKAALYLVHDGSTQTEHGMPVQVIDNRTKQEKIGEFGHYPSKLKRYHQLISKLPAEPILDWALPLFLDDEQLTDFIDELEELKEKIDGEEQLKSLAPCRAVVVEHDIVSLDDVDIRFPVKIIPASDFKADFNRFAGQTLIFDDGMRECGTLVSYKQTFLRTHKTDRELIYEYRHR